MSTSRVTAIRLWMALFACPLVAVALGCGDSNSSGTGSGYGAYGGYGSATIKFKDDVQTNSEVPEESLPRKFKTFDQKELNLADYQGKKNVVLVFTRGLGSSGTLCPFCLTQTSRLITNYSKFTAHDAEVVVVFPGPSAKVGEFASKAASDASTTKAPFPLVLDEELEQVKALGIQGDLARPSTYILDKQGQVRFAYVGEHTGDRPSVMALLSQLDLINRDAAPKPAPSSTP